MPPALVADADGIIVQAAPAAELVLPAVAADLRPNDAADPIERALRLGAAALGCPLIFTEATARADNGRAAFLPHVAFETTQAVLGDEGEALGVLHALDLAARAPFGEDEVRALADVAHVIGADIAARGRIGRFDHVTRLPNRTKFEADFPRLVAESRGERVLTLVTLADARQYNDLLRALGHAYAESFVRHGAAMIGERVGSRRLYHVSVLSFAFLTDSASGDAPAIARDLVAAFAGPVTCDGIPIATRIGVGLTRIDPLSAKPSEALRSALAAAQDSRRAEQGFAFYDRRSDEAHLRAFNLLTDLDTALKSDGQLALAFQPRIDLATGGVAGAEALIRWNHPALGAISPVEFVPLSEATALIGPLTDWVLANACRSLVEWRAYGLTPKISVNISPTSLHDGGFMARTRDILASSGVDPAHLEFEFTEGMLTSADTGVRAKIDAIRAMGVTIAIDDFGTGYSNLDYLTRLPADVLKIDRSFVQPLDREPKHRKLVRSMIDMAHDLEFRVVAEGVESAAAYDQLGSWGCEEGQGYYMSRPIPAEAFHAFMRGR